MGFSAPEKMVLQGIVASSAGLCATRAKKARGVKKKELLLFLLQAFICGADFL
jgi:hypothetical protein